MSFSSLSNRKSSKQYPHRTKMSSMRRTQANSPMSGFCSLPVFNLLLLARPFLIWFVRAHQSAAVDGYSLFTLSPDPRRQAGPTRHWSGGRGCNLHWLSVQNAPAAAVFVNAPLCCRFWWIVMVSNAHCSLVAATQICPMRASRAIGVAHFFII